MTVHEGPLQGHLTVLKLQSVTQLDTMDEEYGDWNRAVFMKRVFHFFRFRFMYKFVIL